MNRCAAYGAGRNRQPWRIREFLDGLGKTQADIARELKKNRSIVNRTVRGAVNNREVLGYLRELGCPEEYLSLPKDMRDNSSAHAFDPEGVGPHSRDTQI